MRIYLIVHQQFTQHQSYSQPRNWWAILQLYRIRWKQDISNRVSSSTAYTAHTVSNSLIIQDNYKSVTESISKILQVTVSYVTVLLQAIQETSTYFAIWYNCLHFHYLSLNQFCQLPSHQYWQARKLMDVILQWSGKWCWFQYQWEWTNGALWEGLGAIIMSCLGLMK